jgi:chromosome segregation ATPase
MNVAKSVFLVLMGAALLGGGIFVLNKGSLEDRVEDQGERLENVESVTEKNTGRIEVAEKKVLLHDEDIDTLKKEVAAAKKRLEKAEGRLEDAESRLSAAESSVKKSADDLEAMRNDVATLETVVDEARKRLDAELRARDRKISELENHRKTQDRLNDENARRLQAIEEKIGILPVES